MSLEILKWYHTIVKKMPQSNTQSAWITNSSTHNNITSNILSGINAASVATTSEVVAATTSAIRIHDVEVTVEDLRDLLTVIRMIRDLPAEHELKQEFLTQQAVDKLSNAGA